jgi:hypothetical protein
VCSIIGTIKEDSKDTEEKNFDKTIIFVESTRGCF